MAAATAGRGASSSCLFCQIARSNSSSTPLLYSDDRVVAFPDINPSAFRHYLVIPVQHIATVNDLKKTNEDYQLVTHMLLVGKNLLQKDAPDCKMYREISIFCANIGIKQDASCNIYLGFGFHQPPFNSVNHLHLHCFAPPFIPRWKKLKYVSFGPLGGFIHAEELLQKLKPLPTVQS